jgi:alkanesulfonate monooxygenase
VAASRYVPRNPTNVGSLRLLDAAARSDIHDKRLFTALSAATGAAGNSTALVGTPEQVTESLLAYLDVGVTTILIRGYDPLEDAQAYGEVISLVRREVAARDRLSLNGAH